MKTPQEIAEMISKRFYPLPDADLDSLASIIESSKAAKGELLLDNGQISKYLYYVESGLLRQFYYKNKRDITEHFSCEGNIGSPDKPGGLSIQLCKSEKKEFYIRYSS